MSTFNEVNGNRSFKRLSVRGILSTFVVAAISECLCNSLLSPHFNSLKFYLILKLEG